MSNILKLAAKNTLRNKRRTILTEVMIVIGIVVILFSGTFIKSMSDNWKNEIVNANLGHFQIMQQGYKEKRLSLSLDRVIQNVDQLAANLSKEPGVAGVTKRISIGGLISTGSNTAPFFGAGIDTASVKNVLPNIYKTIVKGESLFDTPGGAILGEGLAKLLDIKVGDTLMLATYDKYRAMNAVDITVQGIAKIPEDVANDRLALTDYKTAQSLVSFGDEATELVVKTTDFNKLEEIMVRLQTKYGPNYNLEFYSWADFAGSFKQMAGMFAVFSLIINGIIYIIVLVGVANTILMSVFERTSEIGTLMAIGSSRLRIYSLFIAESICLGLIGSIVGVTLHSIIISSVSKSGIPISPPGTTQRIFLYPQFDWNYVFFTCISVIIIVIIAALYPARFASRMNPIDAIRST